MIDFQSPITPFQEPEPSTPPGQALLNPAPYLNTILFISVLTISSIVILYLVRKKTNIFRKLITTLLLMISFGVFAYYILIASIIFQIPFTTYQLLLSVILAILVTYFIIRGRELGTTLSSAIIASGAGVTHWLECGAHNPDNRNRGCNPEVVGSNPTPGIRII